MKKGKPWVSQYPRRKDGGFKNGDLRLQIRKAKLAIDTAEYNSVNIDFGAIDPMFELLQHAASQLQEATDMFAEMYNIDRDEAKARYIKTNFDCFVRPDLFLEPEETEQEFIDSVVDEFLAEQKMTPQE
jgi:hypothetical protein